MRAWAAGAAAVAISLGLLGGVANWGRFYAFGADDGIRLASRELPSLLPSCTAINATGDTQKFADALPGHRITRYTSGPRALSHGVHYFFLSPKDVVARYSNMTPAFARWIRHSGVRVTTFSSHTYRGLELWRVPSSPYAQFADAQRVREGLFVNAVGSACGGYEITNRHGNLLDLYVSFGGKRMLGRPLSRSWTRGGHSLQVFDGAVLSVASAFAWDRRTWTARDVHSFAKLVDTDGAGFAAWARRHPAAARALRTPALPTTERIVPRLAAHRLLAAHALPVPTVAASDAWSRARRLLRDRPIAEFYLRSRKLEPARWPLARRRYGAPLGPPKRMPDGEIRQPFESVILERQSGSTRVRFAPIGRLARAAGLVPPAAERAQSVPHLDTGPPPVIAANGIGAFLVAAGVAFGALGFAFLVSVRRRVRNRREEADAASFDHSALLSQLAAYSAASNGGRRSAE